MSYLERRLSTLELRATGPLGAGATVIVRSIISPTRGLIAAVARGHARMDREASETEEAFMERVHAACVVGGAVSS